MLPTLISSRGESTASAAAAASSSSSSTESSKASSLSSSPTQLDLHCLTMTPSGRAGNGTLGGLVNGAFILPPLSTLGRDGRDELEVIPTDDVEIMTGGALNPLKAVNGLFLSHPGWPTSPPCPDPPTYRLSTPFSSSCASSTASSSSSPIKDSGEEKSPTEEAENDRSSFGEGIWDGRYDGD